MDKGLSQEAKNFIKQAYKGIDSKKLFDYHNHIVGIGTGNTGAYVNPSMLSGWHFISKMKFKVYASGANITDLDYADQQYHDRLIDLINNINPHGKYGILAFDKHYRKDGTVNANKTEFYTPNDYIINIAKASPKLFEPIMSVHPYRKDAIEALRKYAAKGVKLIKWLPNAMGIDPADVAIKPYYEQVKKLGLSILVHVGEEKAVEAEEDQKLGNPLRLRLPLNMGVKVIMAHCASLGQNIDIEDPKKPKVDNFDLFLRLMNDVKYTKNLMGEISAMPQANRLPRPLATILRTTRLHSRLVNGSDYPLPALNVVVRTGALESEGFINTDEKKLLDEIYDYNPLLFDFILKRVVKDPQTGAKFKSEVFYKKH